MIPIFSIPTEPLLVFILVLARVALFFAFFPIFGDLFLPARVRMLFAVAVSLCLAPLLFSVELAFPLTLSRFIAMMLQEFVLGASFGLVGRILFAAVQFGGHIMGEQIGFGMAQQMDPTQSGQMPVFAQMLFIASILLFFAVNAHHVFIQLMAQSFHEVPPGNIRIAADLTAFFVEQGARLFYLAVQISLPVVAVVFITNAAMGMLAKGVPQINVFLESFPIRIMVGLFMMSVVVNLFVKNTGYLFDSMMDDMRVLLHLFRP